MESDEVWHRRYLAEIGDGREKPSPIPWMDFFLDSMKLDRHRGEILARRVLQMTATLLEDSLSATQELILSGDVDTLQYQIGREKGRSGSKFELSKQKSILQWSAMIGPDMLDAILKESYTEGKLKGKTDVFNAETQQWLNEGDVVTGMTAFHFALLAEDRSMLKKLIEYGINVDARDKYFATAFDYARLLEILPSQMKPLPSIKVWNSDHSRVHEATIQEIEDLLSIQFCRSSICSYEYIEELMFSGITIDPDLDFRKKYHKMMYASTGDENLILGHINSNVGYGVFAARDFEAGDFIVRYNGHISSAELVKGRSYCMQSGIEGVVLDAKRHRNLGGMINHSEHPNAEAQCIFDRGSEQAIITALTKIPMGTQILIDYSKNFWSKKNVKAMQLENLETVPPLNVVAQDSTLGLQKMSLQEAVDGKMEVE
eukprot:TRINITY_DN14924_c0_g1_i1.p1 TRINITY_DN14924_c0_g1~~TRINITY_DN14924_c0_g1_i1.p1  ORF type:complete len:444 (+),score=108.04 TRINITY_DN14924_c0_g1_i1:44-1333(+)